MAPYKICTKCNQNKPLSQYYKDKRSSDGRFSSCKDCYGNTCKKYRDTNSEKVKTNAKKYREENKDTLKERSANYYLTNKGKINARNTKYYSENREHVLNRQKEFISKHPELVRTRIKKAQQRYKDSHIEGIRRRYSEYYRNNPDVMRRKRSNRRARIKGSGEILSPGITKKLFEQQKGLCPCCGLPLEEDYHLDHIMPLALGGTNTDDNIQLLRAKCNLQKGAQHPDVFMEKRGFLPGENALTKLGITKENS